VKSSVHDLHRASIRWIGDPDPETDTFLRDLVAVSNSVHQGMVIYGPWMEARLSHLIRSWLPMGWTTSGPAQVFNPEHPELRTRSWDIIIHREGLEGVPPEAAPGAGWPLIPVEAVGMVIDTKTNFSDPRKYAAQTAFNLMNDCEVLQFDLLGATIPKVVLTATSSMSPDSLRATGEGCGLAVFGLGRYQASPVSDGPDRNIEWAISAYSDGTYPFQEFKRMVEAVG
jgi:hypothetical protein